MIVNAVGIFFTGQTTYKSQLTAGPCFVGAPWILQHNKDQKTVENLMQPFRCPECIIDGATTLVLIALINGHYEVLRRLRRFLFEDAAWVL